MELATHRFTQTVWLVFRPSTQNFLQSASEFLWIKHTWLMKCAHQGITKFDDWFACQNCCELPPWFSIEQRLCTMEDLLKAIQLWEELHTNCSFICNCSEKCSESTYQESTMPKAVTLIHNFATEFPSQLASSVLKAHGCLHVSAMVVKVLPMYWLYQACVSLI
jgi:hypothetical protein